MRAIADRLGLDVGCLVFEYLSDHDRVYWDPVNWFELEAAVRTQRLGEIGALDDGQVAACVLGHLQPRSQHGSYLRPWRDADLPRLLELHDQLTAVAGVDAPRVWRALHDRLAGKPRELISVWSTGEIEARVRERIAELELDVAEPPPTPRWRTRRTL